MYKNRCAIGFPSMHIMQYCYNKRKWDTNKSLIGRDRSKVDIPLQNSFHSTFLYILHSHYTSTFSSKTIYIFVLFCLEFFLLQNRFYAMRSASNVCLMKKEKKNILSSCRFVNEIRNVYRRYKRCVYYVRRTE